MRGKNEPSGSWTGEFFRVNSINLNPAAVTGHVLAGFRFSTSVAGTCDQAFCVDLPNFTLQLFNDANGALLGQQTSTGVGVVNDDVWRTVTMDVTNIAGVTAVNLVLFNSQPSGANGNDIGIDNIFLTPFYCPNAPAVQLVKSANTTGLATAPQAGETVVYTLTVSNTGNVDLDQAQTLPTDTMTYNTTGTGAAVDTPMTITRAASSPDNNNGILEVGETIVYTGSFVLDQKAIDAAGVHNTATTIGDPVKSDGTQRTDLANIQDVSDNDLTGDGTDGGPGGTNADPTVVTLNAVPTMTIGKVADDDTLRAVGNIITYTYTVTNTGNVTINNVSITDTHNGSGPAPTPQNETIATDVLPNGDSTDVTTDNGPGDSVRFTGTYTVTQNDVDTLQ